MSTGQVFTYTNWNNGEPNNEDEHCVMILARNALVWNDALCSSEMGYICEEHPLFKEKNVEIALLKESLEIQTNLLMDKVEELGALKREFMAKPQEILENQARELASMLSIQEKNFDQLKQNQEQFISMENSSQSQITELKHILEEIKTSVDKEFEKNFKERRQDFIDLKLLSEYQTSYMLNQTQMLTVMEKVEENIQSEVGKILQNPNILNPISYAVQEAMLRVKIEELEALKKTNEMLINQLFAVLAKSYEANMSRSGDNNYNYNFPHTNKN